MIRIDGVVCLQLHCTVPSQTVLSQTVLWPHLPRHASLDRLYTYLLSVFLGNGNFLSLLFTCLFQCNLGQVEEEGNWISVSQYNKQTNKLWLSSAKLQLSFACQPISLAVNQLRYHQWICGFYEGMLLNSSFRKEASYNRHISYVPVSPTAKVVN